VSIIGYGCFSFCFISFKCFGIKIIEKAIYCEFCGVHVRVVDEWYEYLKNMGEWFK
jgi:hypothetical protein